MEHEAVWNVLAAVLILLAGALVAGVVFERLKQSAILGYLLAGTLLGPNVLAVIGQEQSDIVFAMAELGVALLLFAIGLEFSVRRLLRMGKIALGGGLGQIILTTLVAAGVWYLVRGEFRPALAVGLILALSSTACVLRVLLDRGAIDSMHGRGSLGVLLMQDAAVVPAVLLVTLLTTGGSATDVAVGLGQATVLIILLIAGFYAISRYILPILLRNPALARNRELLILLAVVLALGSTYVAHALSLSPAMGAFIAGILLAESPFAGQIRADVGALRTLFVTLFFVSIGMLGDPVWMADHWWQVIALVGAIFVGKTFIAAFALRLVGYSVRHATATGMSLAQVGEFSFVLAAVAIAPEGVENDLIKPDTFKLIVSATLVTLFATPYLVAGAPWVGKKVETVLGIKPAAPIDVGAPGDLDSQEGHEGDASHGGHPAYEGHIIIIGFGPAGQRVASTMLKMKHPALVIDMNTRNIETATQFGLPAMVGDVTSEGVLEHAGLAKAIAVVVALPDHRTVMDVVHRVRAVAPEVPVIARARQHVYSFDIALAGAEVVVDEEMLVGRRLGRETAHWIRRGRSSAASDETGALWGTRTTEPMPETRDDADS